MNEEPIFRIRARDPLGPSAVEAWALLAEMAANVAGVDHLREQAAEARERAEQMRSWQAANPGGVRWPT